MVHVNGPTLTLADGAKRNVHKCIPYVTPEPSDFTDDVDDNTVRLAQFDHLAQPPADDTPLQQQATVAPTPSVTPPWAAAPDLPILRCGTCNHRQREPYSAS